MKVYKPLFAGLALALSSLASAQSYPNCASAASDPDGDGWGWENNQSCIVVATTTTPNCASAASDPDGDGWGWENNQSCIVVATTTTPNCASAASDPDGDGWGWENNQSCIVVATTTTPNCASAASDPDGDGWGWENNQSCIVVATTTTPNCASAASDPDGDGWGWENNQSCIVVSGGSSSSNLVNGNSSTKTKSVYSYLQSIWRSKILSGQQDLTWNDSTDMYQRVLNDTGRAPAIMGYDFMEYNTSGSGSGRQQTQEAIQHWNRGGLVTFCWHWRDPTYSTNAFYTTNTNFKIPMVNGNLDTSHADFSRLQRDIDTIAGQLKVLRDNGVTVLWRPLHEASGGWFWWGRSRTDGQSPSTAFIKLWQYMYDRMTNYHGLNNLIWVWNGQSGSWYPGNQYVDLASTDIYANPRDYSSQISLYNATSSYTGNTKMVALSENSNIPDPNNIRQDGAWWLFFVTWNDGTSGAGVTASDNFWSGEYYNTNAHKRNVYAHDLVITLDELPDF